MQGLGNDFAVLDATREAFNLPRKTIQQMADRRFGIGFDQLLVLEAASDKEVDFNYRIFNADGGEVAQCGNGARCLARYIKQKDLIKKDLITLKTASTTLQLKVEANNQVTVSFPAPIFTPAAIPFKTQQKNPPYHLQLSNTQLEFGVVNVGNPHAIVCVDDINQAPLNTLGMALARDASFPEGVNVGFMQIISSEHIQLRVLERGAGETLACGSGACAAMTYGREQNWLSERVKVTQAGGDLEIVWPGLDSALLMTGPAEFVYQGQWLAQ